MIPAFTTTDRWCSEHRTERLWLRNGVTCCATCDNALEWVTCEPTRSLLPARTRRVVEFWLIVAVCLVPAIAAVRWWWA